ncbi:ImmA/IrrE family metallo-endopeptidase [Corynebacterium ulcerans]|uniref:ImmA/IrrE family metallo-endopeptidase n=1 Tax=Corynebacterium ulcerans TaxID=65058 RepID=UPI001E2AEBC4|nr:ImmA/IrrE family metallo-endopeptidase [Corynebacterium ulcerans]
MNADFAESQRLAPDQILEIRERARKDASEVLKQHWDLNYYPVDPVKIAREIGAEVFWGDLVEDFDGMLIPARAGDLPQIYVDTDCTIERSRFTTAHELGHLIEDGDEVQVDRRRDARTRAGTDPHEVYANEFAASLLMPEFAIRQLRAVGMPDYKMADFFAVSMAALKNRLNNLGI